MKKKGQGTFEYVLLLAGVLLIVVLAIVLLRGGIFGGGAKDVQLQACARQLAQGTDCYKTPGSGEIDCTKALPATLPDACKVYKETYNPLLATCGDVFTSTGCPASVPIGGGDNIAARGKGTITFTVTDAVSGDTLYISTVGIYAHGTLVTSGATTSGWATFALPEDSYAVTANAVGYQQNDYTEVHITRDSIQKQAIALTPTFPAPRQFIVTDASTGDVLYTAQVGIYNATGYIFAVGGTNEGSAVFDLPVGTYSAVVSAVGYNQNEYLPFEVKPGYVGPTTVPLTPASPTVSPESP